MNIPALIAAVAFLIFMVGLTVAALVLAFEVRKTAQKVNAELDKLAEITDLLVGPSKDLIAFLGKLKAYVKEPLEVAFTVLGSIFSSISSTSSKNESKSGGGGKVAVAVISLLDLLATIVKEVYRRKRRSKHDEEV
ncbi:MAG: hypothetical protein LBP35_00100 [Candidatus Ancillula trichonymphae]|nr:hypothetical protein [Candidatus Ancillula trichonymphae]